MCETRSRNENWYSVHVAAVEKSIIVINKIGVRAIPLHNIIRRLCDGKLFVKQ